MAGKIIVIEGSCDGIGKSTQYKKLIERLKGEGYDIYAHHFPTYDTPHGMLVQKYLNGDYGDRKNLPPYLIADFYAIDRGVMWQLELKQAYEEGKIILLDRYTTSSLFYLSSEFDSKEEVIKFVDYNTDFEYNKLGIHAPDLVIFLTAPYDLAMEMKNAREQNDGIKNDIHEKDTAFMKRVYDNSLFVADYQKWSIVDCSRNHQLRSIDDIHEEVYQLVKKIGI